MDLLVRHGSRVLAGLAGGVAIILGANVLPADAALWVSDLVYPIVAIGAGVLLAAGASYRTGRGRVAWSLFGLGVVLLGIGELTWAWYELVMLVEPPFPGLPDVYYLAAYPVLAAAVLVTPRLAANRFQRGQQIIDALVIIVGVSILAWMAVLGPMYEAIGEVSDVELLVSAAYPIGDALLIATIGIVGLRRSFHARDRSLWYVLAALAVTAVGDVIYLVQSWSDSYVSGSWVDSTWLVGYGLFALAANWLPKPVEPRQVRERRLPIWHVLIPVGVIVTITGIHLGRKLSEANFDGIMIETTLALLGLLVLARILFTVGEDRYLVDEERKRLISVVSHELRTPLTGVDGYIDLALANWNVLGDAEKREMIEIAQGQSRLVTRIVTDLVATSRDNLHSTELDFEVVDAGDVVEEVVARIGIASRVLFEHESASTVTADRVRLAQIITNLVTNADRYGGGGTIRCVLRQVGDQIELAVHDAGPGVPTRFQESVWGAFDRGVHRFDAATPGSGLGLAIVRSLARAHHGSAGYRPSELLGGGCFWVRLPRAESEPGQSNRVVGEPQIARSSRQLAGQRRG